MSARDALLAVLAEAASQEQARMQSAVTQLQHWETTPQFNATLQVSLSGWNRMALSFQRRARCF